MEVMQLRALVMIHHEGSFTRAAERLHVSQPALSQQIKALERELGAPLFVRSGRRNRLTAVGEIAVARAEQALAQLAQLEQEIESLASLARGRVHIGTSDTICLYLLPPLIRTFRQRHPQIEIHLTNRPSQAVVELLQRGEIDFGIVTLPVQGEKLESLYLCDWQEVAVCAADYSLNATAEGTPATAGTLAIDALGHHPLLLLEQGTTSRGFLDQSFAQAGVVPQVMELGSIEVLKRYAEIELGLAIVPELAVQAEVAAGRLCSFALPWLPKRAIGIVRLRDQYLAPAAQALIELIQQWPLTEAD